MASIQSEGTRWAGLTPGHRLGPYEILDFLGAGGMGEVYRAHDTNLGRVVALKLLPRVLLGDRDRVRRFEEEARAASALTHPAVVTVYDAGQIGAHAFISMELVTGETLRQILRGGALPLPRALRIADQIAEGLAHAHEAGLIHRDLKPENIKVSADGFAKILDFGLAKRIAPDLARVGPDATRTAVQTEQGTVLGTIGYMSPEQATGGQVEYASDQFSFGAILYELLTGRRAFDKPTPAETLSAIIREEPVPIVQLNPAVPPSVRWIVERCLAKDAAGRYALTRELARDLGSVTAHVSELTARPASRGAARVSLAVLPLVDLSAAIQRPLADTMTDALITELTQCHGLHVLSRLSSMPFKDTRATLSQIADRLGVGWLVIGTVAVLGRQLRVTAQLVDAATEENRWAHSYLRPARNVLDAETAIAHQIAREIAAVIASAPDGSSNDRPGHATAPARSEGVREVAHADGLSRRPTTLH